MGFINNAFLDKSDKKYHYQKREVDKLLNSRIKPYILDVKHLKKIYDQCYVYSHREFALNYCFGFFMLRPKIDSMVNREAMFIEISKYVKNNSAIFDKKQVEIVEQ